MTVDEMKVVITADNSDASKKIKELNKSIEDFKNKVGNSFGFDSKVLEKSANQIQKIQQNLSLNQSQAAERQSLAMLQLKDKEFARQRLLSDMLMSREDFMSIKHEMAVEHLSEQGALKKDQLNERTAIKELQLLKSNAQAQINLAEKTRQNKEEMYEKLFVQQTQLEKKIIKETEEKIQTERQNKQEMYEKLFVQQRQLEKKRIKEVEENIQKERQNKQEMYERLFITAIQLEEKRAEKEIKLAKQTATKKQELYEKIRLKQVKAQEKKEKGSLFNKAIGSFAIGNLIGIGALASAGTIVAQSFKKSMKDAMNSVESESLFQISLGEQADEVRKWSEQISGSLGLNANMVRKDTANIYHMIRSMDIAESSAVNMAKGVTLLSKDIASFQNKDPEQVYERITAGLMGQTRGLHLMGYAVTEANVKQYAYAHGITEVGKRLTEQEKVVSRYLLLMEQTQQTHGNLALKLNSTANQMMMLNANMEILSRTIGELFLPFLNKVIPYLNAFVKLLSYAVTKVKEFFGIKGSEEIAKELTKNAQLSKMIDEDLAGASNNADELANNMKKANKEAQKQLAAFDEMNVVDKKKNKVPKVKDYGLGSYGKSFSFPISDYTNKIETATNKANTIFEKMKESFANLSSKGGMNFRGHQLRLPPEVETWINTKMKEITTWFAESPEKISKWFNETNSKMSTWYTENTQKLSEWYKNTSETVGKWFADIPQKMQETGSKISVWFNTKKEEFKTWSTETGQKISEGISTTSQKLNEKGAEIKTWLNTKKEEFKTWSSEVGTNIGEGFSKIGIKMSEKGSEIKTWLNTKKAELSTWASETGTKIANFFASLPEIIFNSIKTIFQKIKNWFTEKWSELTSFISGNKNTTPNYSYTDPRLKLGLPKFATGGIVDKPTYAQIGEAGKEAVVPLERNTGWIDMLASKLNGNGQSINLTVKIGEDNIINRVIDGINNKSVEMGRGMVMV